MAEASKKQDSAEGKLAVAGLLAIVVGVLGSVDQIWKHLDTLAGRIVGLPPWGRWAVVGALAAVGVVLLVPYVRGLFRHSRLLRPERFRLDARDPAHLVGREEDVAAIERACLDAPLVWLTGESGVGKSAVVRAGLVPKLRESQRLLPVHLEGWGWGRGWEDGPRLEVAAALWTALTPQEREKLALDRAPNRGEVTATLKRVRGELGLTPLLVFDQFDDYQARYRDRFLPPPDRRWLRAEELTAQNAFWRDVAALLRSKDDLARALVVTRDDPPGGLESVRFVEPISRPLLRLPPAFVTAMMERVTADDGKGPIVAEPERGWERLRQRFIDDLGRGEAVLPQQVRTALLGLRNLPRGVLSEGAYERAGGLPGTEALYIEGEVRRIAASRRDGLTEDRTLELLKALIDDENPRKTIARSISDIAARLNAQRGANPVSEEQVERTLLALEEPEVVRPRPEPDSGASLWQLDHDYLTGAVREAERRANRWVVLLREGHEAYRKAGRSLGRRWRSLLELWPQVRLLGLRVRGRFRYGEHRPYALLSLIRFAPLLLLFVGFGLGWFQLERWQAVGRADELWKVLELRDDQLPQTEIDALWELARGNSMLRKSVIEQVISSEGAAATFNRRPELVVRAVIGLDFEWKNYIGRQLVSEEPSEDKGFSIKLAQLNLGAILSVRTPEFYKRVSDVIIHSPELISVQTMARRWYENIIDSNAADASLLHKPIVEAISRSDHPFVLELLARVLATLAGHLKGAEADQVVAAALEKMKTSEDPPVIASLAQVMVNISKIDSGSAEQAVQVIVGRIVKSEIGYFNLESRIFGFFSEPERLEMRDWATEAMQDAMEREDESLS